VAPLEEEPPNAVPGVLWDSVGCRLCRWTVPVGIAPAELIVVREPPSGLFSVGGASSTGLECAMVGASLLCFTSCQAHTPSEKGSECQHIIKTPHKRI
jgi:hypothetical protein